MSLIAMAVYDTAENQRTKYTLETLRSIDRTVDLNKHRMFVIDNNSCEETKELLDIWKQSHLTGTLITNETNLGTAEAINLAWKQRQPGEHCIKMDNDVVIHTKGWVEELEYVVNTDPTIGQAGLKRVDCWENPDHVSDFYKSKLRFLKNEKPERWFVVEEVKHVMGTCVLHSSALLDKVGYLNQPGVYGFDDSFMSLRSRVAGFTNVFVPHIRIEHIDTGDTPYQKWKELEASSKWTDYNYFVTGYSEGTISPYYNPYE